MPAGATPSSPGPRSSRVVAPSAPVAMPSLPPAPPAAAQDEVRPLPPMKKMKLLFAYAVSCVFGGMGRTWGMAILGLHIVICIVRVVSFTTDPEEARFWIPIFRVWVYLCFAAIVLMKCVNLGYYMPVHGVYAVKYDPQQPAAAAAAAVQLPPPPPEMDMC